jgi:hypothetical protein
MASSMSEKRHSVHKKNLKKINRFNEEDRDDAIMAVKRISQLSMNNTLKDSDGSIVFDFDALETTSDEPKTHLFSMNLNSEDSHSSYLSQERAIFGGSNRGSFDENENMSISIESNDRSDPVTASSERSLGIFSGIRRRKKKNVKYSPKFVSKALTGNNLTSPPMGAWMCGVCAKRFSSYEDACRHEDYHIREIVSDLGWAQTSLDLKYSFDSTEMKSLADVSLDEPQPYQQERYHSISGDQIYNNYPSSAPPEESIAVTDTVSKLATSRPDRLTVSSSTRVSSTPNFSRHFHLSSYKTCELDDTTKVRNISGHVHEYQELIEDQNNLIPHKINDYVVLADEALADVCCKAQKLALSQIEKEAEFELECYSKDKHYYDMLEKREIERQRDGAYSRFRTEGHNFAEKIQNKFVDAYAVMKQGKPEKTTASVDHYKRKLEGDPDVQNVIDNTKQTIYVNVIVKNSIQVVSHELDRLARQRWEEHKENEGTKDLRNEESRAQFEKFKARAQGQLVQLAGLALASDFTPRRIAVQLSNDLYR